MVAIMTVNDKRQDLDRILKILNRRKAGDPKLGPINFCPEQKRDILLELDEIFAKTSQATGRNFGHNDDLRLGVDELLSLEGEIEKFGPGDLSFILPRIHTVLAWL
jgi:hypothetical protein